MAMNVEIGRLCMGTQAADCRRITSRAAHSAKRICFSKKSSLLHFSISLICSIRSMQSRFVLLPATANLSYIFVTLNVYPMKALV